MEKELLFFEPVEKKMIWGKEVWTISAHQNGDCKVKGGGNEGKYLSELWMEKKHLFGESEEAKFPLLIKEIHAKDDLSIQVHPDNTYAQKNESGENGKTECWYILDCDEDATIIIGHNIETKEELQQMIEEDRWNELLREIPIKKGDFFQINPGTIHAIKQGTKILEVQQNSDITYRLYDYGRLQNGAPRELHLEKSLDVIQVPFDHLAVSGTYTEQGKGITELVSCDYYRLYHIHVNDQTSLKEEDTFVLVNVIDGTGVIGNTKVKKGDSCLVPRGYGEVEFQGDMELIVAV